MNALKIWLAVLIWTAVLVGLSRLSRWLYWLTIPVAILAFINTVGVSMIIAQNWTGYKDVSVGYLLQRICAGVLPVVSLGVYGYYDFRHRRSRAAQTTKGFK
jgi:hypothetical protein